jgi:hypothetical protein
LAISKTVRFSIFRDIKNKDDNIEIVDYMPTLNRKTKSPKIMLEKKDNIVIIKKKAVQEALKVIK